jgi:hypothetical protein
VHEEIQSGEKNKTTELLRAQRYTWYPNSGGETVCLIRFC